jgi:hypothetical protein
MEGSMQKNMTDKDLRVLFNDFADCSSEILEHCGHLKTARLTKEQRVRIVDIEEHAHEVQHLLKILKTEVRRRKQ